ncbi:uncharacterized protein LOC125658470 [Ostrea edulis]|uniref:uncharacterized protein LOC125658470 n=1 Tax=Ostrea edulis TaxID=37623 RepID=UPI0024AF61BE|nr:uncharacterized protein LOC125658470 [Ostrea edulis]
MAEDSYKECKRCCREMSCIDEHEDCYRHRSCSEALPCKVCRTWSKEKRGAVARMIEKHKQKNKKPATVSRPCEDRAGVTQVDPFKGKKVATPVESLRDKTTRVRVLDVEPTIEFSTVLSSEQITVTSNEAAMSSHSHDISDNCMAVPSSEHESPITRPGHSYDQIRLKMIEMYCASLNHHVNLNETDSRSDAGQSSTFSNPGTSKVDWKGFVSRVASDLSIPMKEKIGDSEYKSYVAEHLLTPKEARQFSLPLEGSIVHALEELDENIEEGIMCSSELRSQEGAMPYKFNNKAFESTNSEFRKMDMSSRLLLRQISYGSLITTFLDRAVSDEDRQEAIQALSQLFHAMADVTSRVMLNSVTARRSLYLKDMAFKNKATENKLLRQSAIGPKLFGGKFFEVLHSSAENLRDAKETQHLRDLKRKDLKRKVDDSRGSKASDKTAYSIPKKRNFEGYDRQDTSKDSSSFRYKPQGKQSFKKPENPRSGFRPRKQ